MALACDSHVHIVGDLDRHPFVAGRAYTGPAAPLEALRAEAEPHGIGRFVIVQPSFYGTDNRVTLEASDALGSAGRAVAVVDPATRPDILTQMHGQGVRGLRINLYSVLASPMRPLEDVFIPMRDVARRMGWHVQVLASAAVLTGAAAMLAGAGVPVVIDHYGLPGEHTPVSDTGRQLLALARQNNVWVKLSGPCRSGAQPMRTAPLAEWVAALLDAAPDRTVWGSDWPHTPFHDAVMGQAVPHLPWRSLSYAALIEQFRAALPAGTEDAVMVSNPARLYGFDEA